MGYLAWNYNTPKFLIIRSFQSIAVNIEWLTKTATVTYWLDSRS